MIKTETIIIVTMLCEERINYDKSVILSSHLKVATFVRLH